jgi:RNA polymerase sigma-B factor
LVNKEIASPPSTSGERTRRSLHIWTGDTACRRPTASLAAARREKGLLMIASRAALLSSDELFERWRAHRDPRARAQLAEHFMPLTRNLARRYLGAGEPLEDLLQVASLGLLRAIDRFDPDRGVSFTSFAVPTILGELKRYFRDSGWSVHVPRGLQELALKAQQAGAVLSARTGRSPTIPELAQYLEISIEDAIEALQATGAHHCTSLETPVGEADGSESTLGETLGADDARFELVDDSVTISQSAGALSVRNRTVLVQYFLEDRTQAEIASRTGVSQMQVSRILRQAIAQLRQAADEI